MDARRLIGECQPRRGAEPRRRGARLGLALTMLTLLIWLPGENRMMRSYSTVWVVDLATGAGPILRGVQRRADAVFGNGIFGDLQARCRLLRLLLYACGVHAIDHVIVVIAAASGKADGALIPAAVVNGARS